MADDLSASVGYGGANNFGDVVLVQLLLNNHIAFGTTLSKWGIKPLVADGNINKWSRMDRTVTAITIFQREVLGISKPDGRVDRHGGTIKALKGSPKAPRKPKSTASDGGDTRYAGLEEKFHQFELEEKAMEAIRTHFHPTKHKELAMGKIVKELLKSEFNPIGSGVGSTVQGSISVASNVEKWVSFVKDFYAIFQPGLGTTGAMASVGTIGFGFALLGPFVTFWGFCIKLIEARSNTEEYQAIASAFTTTAWAFGEACPPRSDDWWRRKRGSLAPLAGYLNEKELNRDWEQARRKTLAGLPQLVTRSMAASKEGMSASEAEKCLKRGMRLMGRQNLCQVVLRHLAKEARNKGKENLATAIEGAAGYYTDPSGTGTPSSVGPIKYPKR